MTNLEMSELSFNEFNEGTFEQWLSLVQKELGERAIESLDWELEDEVLIGPYHASFDKEFGINYAPVQEQYQLISHSNSKEWNRIALESLMGGTNALGIDCGKISVEDLPVILAGIEAKYISVHFVNMQNCEEWARSFKDYCDDASIDTSQLNGSFEMTSLSIANEEMKAWYEYSRKNFPRFRVFTIDMVQVHEQGGSIIHELAWALSAGHEALQRIIRSGASVDDASACLQFNFAVGSSYFPQIAKLRAFRWLWKQVIQAYKPEHACSENTFIHSSTSRYLQTAKDKHNNLLRATTQAMSAWIGGANSIDVLPYNAWSAEVDESAMRWARNIQQLMMEESYFAQYKSVADGSYYLEGLTGKLADAVWKQFQILDSILAQKGIEYAQNELRLFIATHASKQQELVKEGKRVIVGVNRYVNKSDSAVVDEKAQTLSAPFEKA